MSVVLISVSSDHVQSFLEWWLCYLLACGLPWPASSNSCSQDISATDLENVEKLKGDVSKLEDRLDKGHKIES